MPVDGVLGLLLGQEVLVADKGMKLNQLPPADVAQLKKIAEEKVWYPYAKKLDEKGVNGTQALEDLIRYVNQY